MCLNLLEIAVLGRPHGLQGQISLFSKMLATEGQNLLTLKEVIIENQRYQTTAIKCSNKNHKYLIKLKTIDNREQAQQLTNKKVFIARDNLINPEAIIFADLLGFNVVDSQSGQTIGHVTNFANFGAGDILEITHLDNNNKYMLPYTYDAIPTIDEANKTLYVDSEFFC